MDQVVVRTGTPQVEPEIAERGRTDHLEMGGGGAPSGGRPLPTAKFNLPKGADTPEGILARRFVLLPADRQQRSGERSEELLAQTNRVRQLGRRIDLDLASTTSVDGLVKAERGTMDAASSLRPLAVGCLVWGSHHRFGCSSHSRTSISTLSAFVASTRPTASSDRRRVTTKSNSVEHAFDETGDTTRINDFKVGDFSDGDVKTYTPMKRLQTFNVSEGTAYPKSYFVNLILNEADQGNFSETMEKVYKKIQNEVSERLAAALGAQVGAVGWPGRSADRAAVGYAVGKDLQLHLERLGGRPLQAGHDRTRHPVSPRKVCRTEATLSASPVPGSITFATRGR